MNPVQIGNATLYLGNCLEIMPNIPMIDAIITDPPYPNKAGHFVAGIDAARSILQNPTCDHVIAFWDEMDRPDCRYPLVAIHIWHRTNTNRPDNYEAIYEWHSSGKKRPSRVYPFAVIAEGLTGCAEATGHPTQKNERLMCQLISRTRGIVLDPFMGSGSTGAACISLGRKFIGIESEQKYFDITCKRIANAYAQRRLFE